MLDWLRRPKYAQVEKREVPAGLWEKCPKCKALVYRKELERNLKVCPKCGYHHRLPARERIAVTLDPGSFTEHAADLESMDLLDFIGYREKLEEAKRRTGNREACIIGEGTIEGFQVAIAALDFPFMGGSMGAVVGEKVARAAERAMEKRFPLVTFAASGGARMQEGILSLMQLAKTSAAIGRMRDAGLPFISVMCDPTTGGVTASFAYLGDVVLAEPGALIGFAGPRVIEQTIRQKLPEGFQTAEFLLRHGMLDMVVPRTEMRPTLARLLRWFGAPAVGAQAAPAPHGQGGAMIERRPLEESHEAEPPAHHRVAENFATLTPWEIVQIARHPKRPRIMDFVSGLFRDFIELHGDRLYGDDPAMVTGLAFFEETPVAVVGHFKGKDTKENLAHNFGMPHPEGYRKALRIMKLAERMGFPVISFVDTPGAYPGIGAEERGQAEAIARNLEEMSRLRTPILVLIVGEGGSGGALAIGVGDVILMCEYAIYSVISPEGCAAILWHDASRAEEAASALKLTASDLHRLEVIDEVLPEPPGGGHLNPETLIATVKDALRLHLGALRARTVEELLTARYHKYRKIGQLLRYPERMGDS